MASAWIPSSRRKGGDRNAPWGTASASTPTPPIRCCPHPCYRIDLPHALRGLLLKPRTEEAAREQEIVGRDGGEPGDGALRLLVHCGVGPVGGDHPLASRPPQLRAGHQRGGAEGQQAGTPAGCAGRRRRRPASGYAARLDDREWRIAAGEPVKDQRPKRPHAMKAASKK